MKKITKTSPLMSMLLRLTSLTGRRTQRQPSWVTLRGIELIEMHTVSSMWNFLSIMSGTNDTRVWTPCHREFSIGRLHFASPSSGERFYLRTLLTVVRGSRSFEELREMAPTVQPPPSLPDETLGHSTAISLATTLEQLSDLIHGITLPKTKAAKSATISLSMPYTKAAI
jgi:hypothetical protein